MFKNILNLKNISTGLITVFIGAIIMSLATPVYAQSGPRLKSSGFVSVHDVSANNPAGGWASSVAAIRGALVEIRVEIVNEGDSTANRVQILATIPNNIGNTFTFPATLQHADFGTNPVSSSGTVTVIDGSNQQMIYEPGHVRLAGVTNLHNCPNVCNLNDNVITQGGIEVGDIGAGQTVQVMYKARMTNLVTGTPTPTAGPTATPTTAAPTPTPGASGGQGQSQNQQQTSNNCTGANSCSGSANVTVNTPAATAAQPAVVRVAGATVTELPKTGLPLAALGLAGLLPVGLKLRKVGKSKDDSETAKSIWEDREFRKS